MAEKGLTDEIRARYDALSAKAGDYVHRESCTERCPFGIDASEHMKRALRIVGS